MTSSTPTTTDATISTITVTSVHTQASFATAAYDLNYCKNKFFYHAFLF